jgi:hypothetical protein
VRRAEPFVPGAGLTQRRVDPVGGTRRDPGQIAQRPVPQKDQPLRVRPGRRLSQQDQIEAAVPAVARDPMDPPGRLVEVVDGLRGQQIARAGHQPDRPQPALTHQPGHRGADRGRGDLQWGEQFHESGDRRATASRAEVVAVQVEESRPCLHERTL